MEPVNDHRYFAEFQKGWFILPIPVILPNTILMSQRYFSNYPIWIFATFLLSVIYYLIYQCDEKFDKSVFFGGDTWEYQAIAVNFSKGHGIMRWGGGYEDWETYGFTSGPPQGMENKIKKFSATKTTFFYRTPGYPIFMGWIYRVVGVKADVVKKVQLYLLCMVAGSLPLFGLLLFGHLGAISGLLAGFVFLSNSAGMSTLLMAETLTAFWIMVILFTSYAFLKGFSPVIGIVLGAIIGLGLLVKGAIIFIPILFIIYLLMKFIQEKDKEMVISVAALILGLVIVIAPWSYFATKKNGEFVLLSTMGGVLLLDTHNEFTEDGRWHPEYRKDKANPNAYFHNQPKLANKEAVGKVIAFYKANPGNFFPSMYNKVHRGFGAFAYLWIALFAFLIDMLSKRFFKEQNWYKYLIFAKIIFWIALAAVFLEHYQHNYSPNGDIHGANLIGATIKPIAFILLFLTLILIPVLDLVPKFKAPREMPMLFILILGNFVLLTIFFYGSVRFIKVMEYMMILVAINYLVQWVGEILVNFGVLSDGHWLLKDSELSWRFKAEAKS